MPTALESLLDPIGREEFRERYYGARPLLVRATRGKFADLFTWDDLNRLLNASSWPRPEVELAPSYGPVGSASDVIEQCRAGASLIFNQIHLFDAKIGELAHALAAETGEPTNAVLFLSQPSQAAYPIHFDRHDVFVLHLEGQKAWSVYDRTVEKPVHEWMNERDEPPDEPMLQCELAPGDVLYMPRGHWHQALAQRGMSMHVTFGLKARTRIDFLTWLVEESKNDVRLRRELPLTFADEAADVLETRLRQDVAELGDVFLERLRDRATVPSFVEHCVLSDRDVRPFKFPAQLFDDPGAELAVRRFSRPARQRVLVGNVDEKVSISVWGNVFYFPKNTQPLLEFIVSRTEFTYDDARAHAGELTEQGVWNVLNPLLREGILDAG